MNNPEVFLVDSLNRIRRSIEITGTHMNYAGNRRKSVPFGEFNRRHLHTTEYVSGDDPLGYYGVCLNYDIDGNRLIIDTRQKRAMVYGKHDEPVIYDICDEHMITYLNRYFRSAFSDYVMAMFGSGLCWMDYVNDDPIGLTQDMLEILSKKAQLMR